MGIRLQIEVSENNGKWFKDKSKLYRSQAVLLDMILDACRESEEKENQKEQKDE